MIRLLLTILAAAWGNQSDCHVWLQHMAQIECLERQKIRAEGLGAGSSKTRKPKAVEA